MRFELLLEGIEYSVVRGSADGLNAEVTALCYDSRRAAAGCVFVCVVGARFDGHDFIDAAYEKGCRLFLVERDIGDVLPDIEVTLPDGFLFDACVVKTENCRKALALLSARFFGFPANEMCLIGITGTKGKTSTSHMLKNILEEARFRPAVIGSTGVLFEDERRELNNTTPESYELHKLFRELSDAGCTHIIMEVSSQGIKMERVFGLFFDVCAFTNLSPDHIGAGEHEDFEEYAFYKSLLFSRGRLGVFNADDEYFSLMTKNASCAIKTVSLQKEAGYQTAEADYQGTEADYQGRDLQNNADYQGRDLQYKRSREGFGVSFTCSSASETFPVSINIGGFFSAVNALIAIGIAKELGISTAAITAGLSKTSVAGRMEFVPVPADYLVLIDYAHNALSCESIFGALLAYEPNRIICVFGCGGDRPKDRRYTMGEICGRCADLSVITSDNPRFEDPQAIVDDILVGMRKTAGDYIVILDRKDAIHYALSVAKKGDIVALLGKGHEDYLDIKGAKTPFIEREVVKEYYQPI